MRKIAICCLCFAVSALSNVVRGDATSISIEIKPQRYIVGEDIVAKVKVGTHLSSTGFSVGRGSDDKIELIVRKENNLLPPIKKGAFESSFKLSVGPGVKRSPFVDIHLRDYFNLNENGRYTVTVKAIHCDKVVLKDDKPVQSYCDFIIGGTEIVKCVPQEFKGEKTRYFKLVCKDWNKSLYLLTREVAAENSDWVPHCIADEQTKATIDFRIPGYVAVQYNVAKEKKWRVFRSTKNKFEEYGMVSMPASGDWTFSSPFRNGDRELKKLWRNGYKEYQKDIDDHSKTVPWK